MVDLFDSFVGHVEPLFGRFQPNAMASAFFLDPFGQTLENWFHQRILDVLFEFG